MVLRRFSRELTDGTKGPVDDCPCLALALLTPLAGHSARKICCKYARRFGNAKRFSFADQTSPGRAVEKSSSSKTKSRHCNERERNL